MNRDIFDNHAAFNHYQSILGNRPSENYTKPSVHITGMKLRKGFKTLTDEEIIQLNEKPLKILGIRKFRDKLDDRLSEVQDWQLFTALLILLRDGNLDAAKYLLKCRYDETCPYEDEYELYQEITRF